MKKNKKAFSLIATIFVMVMFLLLGMTLVSILSGDVISASGRLNYLNAFYAAQGGVQIAANLLLLNDYNWHCLDNNWVEGGPVRKLEVGLGYPPDGSGLYTGDSDRNKVERRVQDPQFEFARINAFIVWVKTDEAIAPNNEPHLPLAQKEWLGYTCVIDSNGHVQDSSARIGQQVSRYLCPSLKYAISAPGSITIPTGSGVEFNSSLGDVRLLSESIINSNNWNCNSGMIVSHVVSGNGINWFSLKIGPEVLDNYKRIHTPPIRSSESTLRADTYDGIIYCDGNLFIGPGLVKVNGSIIAERDIIINPITTLIVSSAAYAADGYLPALVAGGGISGNNINVVELTGLVVAGGDINISTNYDITVNGAIASMNGNVFLNRFNGKAYINYSPTVRLTYGIKDTHPCNQVNNKLYYGKWEERLVFHKKPD